MSDTTARRGPDRTRRVLTTTAAAVLLAVLALPATAQVGAGGEADPYRQEGSRGETAAAPGASRRGAGEVSDVDRILDRAEAAYDSLRTLRAEFRQVIEMRVFEPPRRRAGHGTWYQERPGRFRMDFVEPEGDLVVSDGRVLWLFYPSTHPGQVVKTRLERGAPGRGREVVDLQGRVLERARVDYEPSYGGRVEIDGHPAHLVELAPRAGGTPYASIRIWIDAGRWLVRKLEFVDRSETVRTVTLDELETGVALPDSLFRFRPPDDVEVFEG